MTKAFTFVQFWEKSDIVLTDALSAGNVSEAACAVRLALACPTSAPTENLDCVRQLTRKTRRILEEMMKKAKGGKTSSGVPVSQLKAAGVYLSVADALTFPAAKDGAGARSRWINALVNVANLPVVARAFLWPERFSLADRGEVTDVLGDMGDALGAALLDYRETGHKSALLGFSELDFVQGSALIQALIAAFPTPCETMAANGREYSTAPTEFFKSSIAN